MTYHAFHLTSTPGSKSLILNAPDVFLKRRDVSIIPILNFHFASVFLFYCHSFKYRYSFSFDILYCCGDIPVYVFTNFPKKEGLAKSNESAISFILKFECFSLYLICLMACLLIICNGDSPVMPLTVLLRYLAL